MTAASSDIRECLLERLLEEPGCFVSGEAASRGLDMTRAAVWKHMQALQQAGWPIESVTRRGYRILPGKTLPYSAMGIRLAMRDWNGNPGNIGKMARTGIDWRVTLLTETDSTNTRLKETAAAGAPEGTVLFAEKQTGGRGRLGRQWDSKAGSGIWMSVLLRPDMRPEQVQGMTLAASVAVVETLRIVLKEAFPEDAGAGERLAAGIGIKWPNDILWNGKKLCGILTELAAEPDRVSHVVIGIGVNVSQTEADFPPEVRPIAASLHMVATGAGNWPAEDTWPDRNRIAGMLLHQLDDVYGHYREDGLNSLLKRWRDASVTLGQDILVMDPRQPWPARAVDVGEDGRLLVERADGTRSWLLSGEIGIRRIDGPEAEQGSQ